MALILHGAPVARAICESTGERAARLAGLGRRPCLAVLRLGEDGSQLAYERAAEKRCAALGIEFRSLRLSGSAGQRELMEAVERINRDDSVHGCLILRPLPAHLDEAAACRALRPEKDVDGVGGSSLSAVFTGRGEGYAPCTAQSCMELLDYYSVELAGAHAAVIGRSLVVGRPLAMLLQARDATVTMCHSRSRNMPELCRGADIIIAAAGRAGLVDKSFVRPGQTVIDVGINPDAGGHIRGDVDFEQVEPVVKAISPVPGGVGAITTAVLAKQLVEAAERTLEKIPVRK